jgi:hypothetical protein
MSQFGCFHLVIVGLLLPVIVGGGMAAHFVLPAAPCTALWANIRWPMWSLFIFLLGEGPVLRVTKLMASSMARVVLESLKTLERENTSDDS